MGKETSARVSSIAAKLINFGPDNFIKLGEGKVPGETITSFTHDVRTLAASCMSQDETPGMDRPVSKSKSEIHPAPAEFSDAQVASDPILHFFHYSHLPPKLQATSRLFFILAAECVNRLPRNAERTVALRKLLEAKDAAVRANVGPRTLQEIADEHARPAPGIQTVGEPREIGGHDEDRDGPISFND